MVSATISRAQPVAVATASSAQRRAAIRSPPANAACARMARRFAAKPGAKLPCSQAAAVASRAVSTSPAARAACPNAAYPILATTRAEFGRELEARLGRGPGRNRVTLPRQRGALVREASRLIERIVIGLGLGCHRTELCEGFGQFALRTSVPNPRIRGSGAS